MAFDALEVSLQLITALREPLTRLRQHDPDLADQAHRAANGVPLQLSEGRRRAAKDRLNRFRMADGSADELATALRAAQAWGYLDDPSLAPAKVLLDRLQAMLWRLTH